MGHPRFDRPADYSASRALGQRAHYARVDEQGTAPEKWALQDQNTPTISEEKPQIPEVGAAKSAVIGGDSFAEAVAGIMRLPLTDAEKAEAVRRLLADHAAQGKA